MLNASTGPFLHHRWSPNKGTAKGKLLVSEAGRKFKHAVRAAIIEQLKAVPKPSASPAEVVIVLYPPDYRRRDLDNYNKALFDALTYAGIWEDDSQVKRMTIEWGENAKGGRVEITITAFNKVLDVCSVVG
ncbi:RusA family crossover junction endodeoxyribonuclease [Klebsiella variicola]|uniref:RusA family crossover junction endodeoxyribonuclease n=1 Tax=Klebsiella variicola TaxID=244366 RepID=UPI000E3B644E|nr:RusA family crossover junction endodeoxyribonuclease [Klebsiella variicola]ELN9654131.1 RusA family crossover junction endodeoxyribonuclease [Klebsiella variicola]